MSPPLVSFGVPVRNGAATLAAALDSIVAQDHPNIEVIVSDNASTDATPDIVRAYVARFPYIRVVRQPEALTAIDNFMFVMNEARGEFFAWCAHDDTRSSDFASGLIKAFADPETVLAFGDLYVWEGGAGPQSQVDHDFATEAMPLLSRLHKAANIKCYHIYGLWRLSALRAIRYRYCHWWSDLPLMLGASALGQFRYIPGPRFCYLEVVKSAEDRAAYQDRRKGNSRLRNFSALFRAILLTLWRTAGLWPAALAMAFVAEKYVREAVRRLARPLRGAHA